MVRDAGVLAKMDGPQLDRVLGVLGGGAEADPTYGLKIAALREAGLTDEQAREAAGVYYDLRIGAMNPGLMISMLEGTGADGQRGGPLLDVFRRILDAEKSRVAGARRQDAAPGAGEGVGMAREAWDPPGSNANVRAFDEFVVAHSGDPEFQGRYVAFVNGRFQKSGESKRGLIREMRGKFGNVEMCVGEATPSPRVLHVDSPELAH